MSAALDMTLDDIIKNNKKSGSGNSRGRSRPAPGPGPARRAPNRISNRATPYSAAKVTCFRIFFQQKLNFFSRFGFQNPDIFFLNLDLILCRFQAPETTWQHDLYGDQHVAAGFPAQGGRAPSIETGTKLYISNLHYGVSNYDIKAFPLLCSIFFLQLN